MRWERLFDDLESQLEQGLTAEHDDIAREDERMRLARIGLRERLSATGGHAISMRMRGGASVSLHVDQVGRDWVCGPCGDAGGLTVVVSFAGILAIGMSLAQARSTIVAAPAPGGLAERLSLPFVLRDLARTRRTVEIVMGGLELGGTIDRVGRDHLELAEHDADEPRRDRSVRRTSLIPLAAIDLVRVRQIP